MEILTALSALLGGLAPIFVIFLLIAITGGIAVFAFRVLVIREFLISLTQFVRDLFALIIPTKWDSARTLIMLGAFSWAMSLLVGTTAQAIIAFVGWFFLIGGIHWVMNEEKELKKVLTINQIFIAPWITGGLICYFLFGTTDGVPAIAFVLWPCISAIIAGIPKFIGSDGAKKTPIWVKPKPGDRQYLINLALINLLLSCWIQLSFTTRQWLADYPTLQLADMRNSAFVIQSQPNAAATSRGTEILTRAEAQIKANLEGQPWSHVERWLLNFDDQLKQVETTALNQMNQTRENAYWRLAGQILPGEYNIQLNSIWRGPSADATGFHFTKTCQISRVAPIDLLKQPLTNPIPLQQVGNARVQCSSVKGPVKGDPAAAAQGDNQAQKR